MTGGRQELRRLVEAFLRTYGYLAKSVNDRAVMFSRPTGLGVSDDLLVYFHEKGENNNLASQLQELSQKYDSVLGERTGRKFFLSPVSLVPVPEAIKENKFTYQVPVLFFDREFTTQKKTYLRSLEEDATRHEDERIAQPFEFNNRKSNNDLLDFLMKELENPKEPCLRIVVAPAGYGKTVLMGSLYSKLRTQFQEEKTARQNGKRPLLMLPGHLKTSTNIDSLINNFIGDEYDYGISNKEGFNFWVNNNFVIWMLDGLEELMLKIPDEFIDTLMEDYIYNKTAVNPQIIVSIRKPLLASSPELKEAITFWQGSGVEVYELSPWDAPQKKAYFEKKLKVEPDAIKNFLMDVNRPGPLNDICSIPYYCSLVADLRNNNEMGVYNDHCELVEYAIDNMCKREFTKGLDREIVPVDTQKELFIELARETLSGKSITESLLMDYADLLLSDRAQGEAKQIQKDYLLRHALLTQIGNDMDFIHDIVKQYLIGLVLHQYLLKQQIDIFEKTRVEVASLTGEYLVKHSHDIDWQKIIEKLVQPLYSRSEDTEAIGLRNIIGVFLLTQFQEKEKLIKPYLEQSNLAGLAFKNLSLREFSFQDSRLTDTKFADCDLENANFDRCFFKNTFIDAKCNLNGATTKGAMFETIITDSRRIDNQKEIARFFFERTHVISDSKEPCQAVINTGKILRKLAKKGKGYWMRKRFVLNIKCGGGVSTDRCYRACIDNGLLTEANDVVRIKLGSFDDVVAFTDRQTSTASILRTLDDICPETKVGCKHIVQA